MSLLMLLFCVSPKYFYGQRSEEERSIALENGRLEAVNVYMSIENLSGRKVVKAIKDSTIKEVDEPTFVKVKGINFKNGTIEVKVLSRLLASAPSFARGFIGVAFRVNDSNTRYESIYVRPLNARVDDQVRRNHTIQYYSYPDFKFDRLRKESPERYESYTDMEMNKWISLRIEIKDAQARLFIDGREQPSLVVNDLKHGPNASGAIALWVDVGTEGFFSELKVQAHDH
jgi:hypothetical protein